MRRFTVPRRNGRSPLDPPRLCAEQTPSCVWNPVFSLYPQIYLLTPYPLPAGVDQMRIFNYAYFSSFSIHNCVIACFTRGQVKRQVPPPYRRENPE